MTLIVAGTYFIVLYLGKISLVVRPSPAPVFDHLQYAKMEPLFHTASDQKLEPGRPGNEAR